MKKVVIVIVVIFVLLAQIISLFVDEGAEDPTVAQGVVCDEYSEEDSVSHFVTHHRSWEEYLESSFFCSDYIASLDDFNTSEQGRRNVAVNQFLDNYDYWGQVYHQLYLNDRERLQSLQDSLGLMRENYGLDREAFARVIVSMVQDIPYQYVLPEPCTGTEASPCNGQVDFGIYSPAEFVYSMKGDCDTRTVLLFTLLKNFGYEPLIINSNEYGHSMLALDIPASGEDFLYKGKKYAYWETTNVGWLPGMIPPGMENEDYWNVTLDYELEDGTTGSY